MPYTVWKGGRTTTAFEQHRYERLEADAIRAELKQKFDVLRTEINAMRAMQEETRLQSLIEERPQ